MADEGPTTAGSIVGKLKMDRDQWIVEKAATIKDAKEISELDPTVTVHANVAEALAEIESLKGATGNSTSDIGINVSGGSVGKVDALTAAEARMVAAMTSARIAAQAEEVAAQRLDAAQTKRGRTDLSVAAAELALARATNTAESAAAKSIAAGEALAKARQEAAAAALEEAAAENTVAKSTNDAGGSLSRIQKILAAVIALGPGLIPIAAFTVGAGAAISAMAGVAVLAVLGIKNELKSGTAEAETFKAGIKSLKTDVTELEKTAANGVLGGFQAVVADLNEDLPELNSETKIYSQLLGAIAGTGFGGVLSAFHSLAPLILDVDSYLLDTTQRLSAFADSPSMRRFVTYAQQSLPTVERLLDSLVAVAFHLLAAFAPWGSLVVDVLQDVVNVINAIPTPLLSTMIELALGGSLAFKAWTSIPAMFMALAASIGATAVAEDGATVATGALGAAIDFMEGPIGWVVAGIAALIAVFAASSVAAGLATQSTNSYTAALQQDNGVIGENVRLQAAKILQDAGAFKMAKDLGISTKTLTSATLGNADAQKVVKDRLTELTKELKAQDEANAKANDGMGTASVKTEKLAADLGKLGQIYQTQTNDIKSSKSAYDDLQVAAGGMAGSNQQQADSYARLASQEDAATKAGKAWKTQLDILNGASQTLEGANIALAADFQNMATTIAQNIKQIGAAQARSLDINKIGGLANHQLILQAVTDAETQSQALIAAEGKTAQAREDGRLALVASRQAIIDHMTALGLDKDAVTALVDSELSIPAHIETKAEIKTAAAAAALDALEDKVTNAGSRLDLRINADQFHQQIQQEINDAEHQADVIVAAEGKTQKARDESRQSLVTARQAIIDHAVAAGQDVDAVTKLVDAELSIPPLLKTQLQIDTAAAIAALKATQAEIQNTLTISHGVVTFKVVGSTILGHAGGGTVSGSGGPTQDNQIRALSVGEEVTRSSRAGTFRPMLKAINNGSPRDIEREAKAIAGSAVQTAQGASVTFGDIYQQPGTTIAETMQAAGWVAAQIS